MQCPPCLPSHLSSLPHYLTPSTSPTQTPLTCVAGIKVASFSGQREPSNTDYLLRKSTSQTSLRRSAALYHIWWQRWDIRYNRRIAGPTSKLFSSSKKPHALGFSTSPWRDRIPSLPGHSPRGKLTPREQPLERRRLREMPCRSSQALPRWSGF